MGNGRGAAAKDTQKICHKTAVLAVRLTNWALFFILCLGAVSVAQMVLLDKLATNSFFWGQLISMLLEKGFDSPLFAPAHWISRHSFAGWACFAVLCALLSGIKLFLDKKLPLKECAPLQAIGRSSMELFINCLMLFLVVTMLFNAAVVHYVNDIYTTLAPCKINRRFDYKVAQIKNYRRQSKDKAKAAFARLMAGIDTGELQICSLSDERYVVLAKTASDLVQIMQEVKTPEQHYLRNAFARAPATLEEMSREITKTDNQPFGWRLMAPEDTTLHMFGKDGEYNLKFVSQNGLFEAVYNRAGELLTEKNDPQNMGTFNFADPDGQPGEHSLYDIWPYLAWGNTGQSSRLYEPDMEHELDTLGDRFLKNADAQARYREYKTLLQGSQGTSSKQKNGGPAP